MKCDLVFLVALSFCVISGNAERQEDTHTHRLRTRTLGDEVVADRQLSVGGWDWSNVLFHLGVCPASSASYCAEHSSSSNFPHCGCPNCHLPHARNLPECSGSSDSSTVNSNGESMEFEGDGGGSGGDSSPSPGQSPTRTISLLVYIVGAAAVATIIGAVLMKKRSTETEADANAKELSPSAWSGSSADFVEMEGSDSEPGPVVSYKSLAI